MGIAGGPRPVAEHKGPLGRGAEHRRHLSRSLWKNCRSDGVKVAVLALAGCCRWRCRAEARRGRLGMAQVPLHRYFVPTSKISPSLPEAHHDPPATHSLRVPSHKQYIYQFLHPNFRRLLPINGPLRQAHRRCGQAALGGGSTAGDFSNRNVAGSTPRQRSKIFHKNYQGDFRNHPPPLDRREALGGELFVSCFSPLLCGIWGSNCAALAEHQSLSRRPKSSLGR